MTTATAATQVTLAIPDTAELAKDQADAIELAEAFVVDSQLALDNGADIVKAIKVQMKRVDGILGPPVTKAHEAHKAAKKVWNTLMVPLQNAEKIYKRKMGDYFQEQERIARVEQQRLEREAREAEETRRLAEAEALEKEGRQEEAEQIIEAPITVAVPPPAPAPKADGISTTRHYKHRITDVNKMKPGYMKPDDVLIGQTVRSHHEAAAAMVGGIEVYYETGVSARA